MSFLSGRISSLPKYILYAVVLYISSSLIISSFSNSGANSNSPLHRFPEIPQLWQDNCQFLENSVQGVEGELENKAYRLRGLGIVFRHGERSPLYMDHDSSECMPFREIDRQKFETYLNKLSTDELKYYIKYDKKFTDFPKLPQRADCESGQLTAEGALQHVRLGEYMEEKYGASDLFDPDFLLNVSITSSQYNRTLQSVVAFTSAFLYPHRISAPSIYIKASDFTFLCTHEACSCPIGKKMRRLYEKEHVAVFNSFAPSYMKDTSHSLRELSPFRHAVDPFEVMDISLGRYICRRKPLPCFGDKCLNYDFLSELLNYTTARGSFMYAEGPKYIAQQLQLVEAHGVLFHIRDMVQRLRQFPHTNMMKIFSGHDTTIGPILRVLGVPFIDFPHYVSRIVFEVLEHRETKKLYLRLIYNGEDLTAYINCCKSLEDGLCALEHLEDFVKNDIPQMLGTKSVTQFCKSQANRF